MQTSRKFANPFYGLLLIAGIAFAMTAMCYGVMAFRDARPAPVAAEGDAKNVPAEHPLMMWMRRHGAAALMIELAFLAMFTFGAIGTDGFWQSRAAARKKEFEGADFPLPMEEGRARVAKNDSLDRTP